MQIRARCRVWQPRAQDSAIGAGSEGRNHRQSVESCYRRGFWPMPAW